MNNDFVIIAEGMAILQEKLGIVETEKFISLINRSKINYTSWRKNLWKDKPLEEIFNEAADFFHNQK